MPWAAPSIEVCKEHTSRTLVPGKGPFWLMTGRALQALPIPCQHSFLESWSVNKIC